MKGSGVGWIYTWAGNGMLTQVILPQSGEVTFTYDALGRRIAKEYKGKITRWLWDGNVPLHEWQYEGKYPPEVTLDAESKLNEKVEPTENIITWLFEENSFVPCGKLVGEDRYSIVCDYLGTPTHGYDSEGSLIWERELDLYGSVRKGNNDFVPFLYQGQYYDSEIGLAYNRFRYYDPEAGNYISQDPIGLEGSMALYGYVEDPNSWVDVFGLKGDYYQIPQMSGHQKHHIIPQSMKHPLLDKLGFDVHQSGNIIQLPTSSEIDTTRTVHRGRHNADYDRMITRRLNAIDALDASDDIKRMHLNDLMENVGDDLRNKRIKLNCH